MITHPTVFVLGAGAHVPYRFSTGEKLVEKARKLTLADMRDLTRGHLHEAELTPLAEALADTFLPSIDALLEQRQDLRRPGKMLMLGLLLLEEAEALKERWAADEDWMSWIFEKMAEGATTLDEFAQNRALS